MIAVRRPSVTHPLHKLVGEGLILSKRGCVIILDRSALANFAGDIYGEPELIYDRLITRSAK